MTDVFCASIAVSRNGLIRAIIFADLSASSFIKASLNMESLYKRRRLRANTDSCRFALINFCHIFVPCMVLWESDPLDHRTKFVWNLFHALQYGQSGLSRWGRIKIIMGKISLQNAAKPYGFSPAMHYESVGKFLDMIPSPIPTGLSTPITLIK